MVEKQQSFPLFRKKYNYTKKTWRPRKFETPEELWETFIEYCHARTKIKRPITKVGFKAYILVNHWYLSDLPEEFSETLNDIDLVCEAYAVEELFVNKNVSGVIFNLVNNYGWRWKHKNELTGKDGEPLQQNVHIYLPDNKRDNAWGGETD